MGDGDGGSSTGLWLYDSTHGRILPVAAVGALLGVAFLVAWVAGVAFLVLNLLLLAATGVVLH